MRSQLFLAPPIRVMQRRISHAYALIRHFKFVIVEILRVDSNKVANPLHHFAGCAGQILIKTDMNFISLKQLQKKPEICRVTTVRKSPQRRMPIALCQTALDIPSLMINIFVEPHAQWDLPNRLAKPVEGAESGNRLTQNENKPRMRKRLSDQAR